jgi:hypothetical protein
MEFAVALVLVAIVSYGLGMYIGMHLGTRETFEAIDRILERLIEDEADSDT